MARRRLDHRLVALTELPRSLSSGQQADAERDQSPRKGPEPINPRPGRTRQREGPASCHSIPWPNWYNDGNRKGRVCERLQPKPAFRIPLWRGSMLMQAVVKNEHRSRSHCVKCKQPPCLCRRWFRSTVIVFRLALDRMQRSRYTET